LEVENVLLRTLWVKRNVELAHHRNHQKSNPELIAGLLFCLSFLLLSMENAKNTNPLNICN